MSSPSLYPSSPPGPSSASGLRSRHLRGASSSQGVSQAANHDYSQAFELDGQEPFSQPLPPVFDDPDDLSYEDSDAGPAPISSGDESGAQRWKGKDKELGGANGIISSEGGQSPYRHPALSDEDEESDELEPRPNKFHGPSGTWLGWTRRERQEVVALDKLRARDLSAHLFNAFSLKKRAKLLASQHDTGAHGSNEQQRDPLFAPPKGWTAWPMPPAIVPRVDEHRFRDESDIWTLRMEPDPRPSAEFEECVIAQMLNAAKERLNARESSLDSGGHHRHRSQLRTAGASRRDDDGHTHGHTSGAESSGLEEGVDVDSEAEAEATRVPMLKPVPLADDERARTILRPAARHTLTKLDELLMGLHHARGAYVATSGGLQVDTETEAEDSQGESPRKKRRVSAASAAFSNEEEDLEQEELQDPNMPAAPFTPPHRSGAQTRKGRRSKRRSKQTPRPQSESQVRRQRVPGQRDWSDVLGLASMIGCSQSAVMNAAQRCADLFEEDMAFRVMDEGRLELDRTGGDPPVWKYTEEGEEETDMGPAPKTADEATIPDYIGKLKEYARFCPVTECPRHTKGFSRTWNLNKHLKAKHPDILRERTEVKSNPKTEDFDR